MSRIGRMPIAIPKGVTVTVDKEAVRVKGPKGELVQAVSPDMTVTLEGEQLKVSRPSDSKTHRAMHGLTRALLANMVQGVTAGFEKGLEVSGVGYRVEKTGSDLQLRVGFTHPVKLVPLEGVQLAAEGTNRIKVSGISKERVGEMAAKIRAIRPPDAYKGKGIRYAGEVVHLKAGKAAKAIGKRK